MSTFPDLLADRLSRDPGRPFVTFYDESTGERTELSGTTYANWVAKTANLLLDELMLDPGDRMALLLPPHWLGFVFLGAAWSAGLEVSTEAEGAPALVVTGPDGVESARGTAEVVLACSLDPFAGRFREPLPDDVLDYGLLWPGQADVFAATEPVSLPEPRSDDRRILTDVDPASEQGRQLLLGTLAGDGSVVLLVNADEGQWPVRSESERATVTIRIDQPIDR